MKGVCPLTTQKLSNYSYGPECFQEMPEVLATYGFRSVVLIGGEKALAAVENEMLSVLQEAGISVTGRFVYGKAATMANVESLAQLEEVQVADLIIGVGGGQALDTTKMVAKKLGKSLVTIPTICSTCAAGTGLAVIYTEEHAFDFYEVTGPPIHTFINTRVIAEAPDQYFWAGIGDGISKGPEVTRAMQEAENRGFEPPHIAVLGRAIAQSSLQSLYQHAHQAMADVRKNRVSQAVEEVVLAIIISTAYASNMVVQPSFDLTTCHAHAFYNGTTVIRASRKHLHGAIVAFGVMVLHAYFEEQEELARVAAFNKELNLPLTLADMSLSEEDIPTIVQYTKSTAEYRNTPFDTEQLAVAIQKANQFGQALKQK